MRTYRAAFQVQHKDRPSRVIFRHPAKDLNALKSVIIADSLQIVEQLDVTEQTKGVKQVTARREALLDLDKAYAINYEDCVE